MSQSIAFYIHFPFCRRKCDYCSFISYQGYEAYIPTYISALKKELAARVTEQQVSSIYLGGGTPSILSSENINDILKVIFSLFVVQDDVEITIEANPGTIDESYLAALRMIGINRLSLGVQSFNDNELDMLGRIHNASEAKDAVHHARKAGFNNLNMDLLYGLPHQDLPGWRDTLSQAIDLDPEHLSLYPLSLEGSEPMFLSIERGEIPALDSDQSADQYELATDLLKEYGCNHYEISNWAKRGYECRHNIGYWRSKPYVGVGVAAHSCLNSHRMANTSDINKYMDAFLCNMPIVRDQNDDIEPELLLSETVIMGLRLSDGVNLDDINNRFGVDLLEAYSDQINELTGLGLLECIEGNIKLTHRGKLLGNEVFCQFIP
ncbi:radical SAM family heme chaperone HemW [Chloroflexota bacterium]